MNISPVALVFLGALLSWQAKAETVIDIGDPDRGVVGYGPTIPTKRPLSAPGSTTAYSHGEPTEYEQLMLELINRARADPLGEAARLGIGLNDGLPAGSISGEPKQALAFNAILISAARGHSQWMLDVDQFSHTGVNGSSPGDRMSAASYPFAGGWGWGENIAWRGTTGSLDHEAFTRALHDGLFNSPGHRENLLTDRFTDIGVGSLVGSFRPSSTAYNAMMTTHKFAYSGGTAGPLLTGVVYRDLNGNGLYDAGEGVAGASVRVVGGVYHTESSTSGGYALPYSSSGSLSVNFESHQIGGSLIRTVQATGRNIKLDLVLPVQDMAAVDRVIEHYYLNILGRAPESSGRDFWRTEATRLQASGVDVGELFMAMANYFFSSPEYLSRNLSEGDFIDSLYRTFFDRAPDASGRAFWINQLALGLSREMLFNSFMFSPEFATFMQDQVGATPSRPEVYVVIDFYRGAFGRLPDSEGLREWVNRFRAAQCVAAGNREGASYQAAISIATDFFESPEYLQSMPATDAERIRSYVSDLYNAFMRRGADPAGFAHWVALLEDGVSSRAQVRRSFIDSSEFAARIQAVAEASCASLL